MLTERGRVVSRQVVEPIAAAMGRLGLSPNTLTVAGCLLHLLVVWPLAEGRLVLAAVALALAAAFDSFDGTLARLTGQASDFGAFLDSSLDRVSEILVFLGLLLYVQGFRDGDPALEVAVLLGLAGGLMTSYTRARSEAIGQGTKAGLFGRFERMLLLVITLPLAAWFGPLWFNAAVWALAVGTWITTVWRIVDVRRLSAAGETGSGP